METTVGDVLKHEGIETVTAHAGDHWQWKVKQAAHKLLGYMEYVTGEDIRLYALETGCGRPHHPNAWGGLLHDLRRSGLIEETDRSAKARDAKSHSRRLMVWKSKLYAPKQEQLPLEKAA